MAKERKIYAKYYIVRGHKTLWRGKAEEKGSQFLEIVITSNEFNSTQGIFQVFALEGTGAGIVDGELKTEDRTNVLLDKDFNGLDEAVKQLQAIAIHAETHGFKPISLIEQLEYEEKRRKSKKSA
jgi:hypothetical protein